MIEAMAGNGDGNGDGLTIGQVAEGTGVAVATLRMWEARYGFPEPRRLTSGHRRYREEDRLLVAEVLRHRAAGLSLEAAIARARETGVPPESSLFAGLRRRHPELVAAPLRQPAMLILSRAIEDECLARAERPVLVGSFQQERFYRRSERRWRELARSAPLAVVYADFARRRDGAGRPTEIPLDAEGPLRREWAIVCDSPGYAACLVGWERPPPRPVADRARTFEAVWTVDPVAVRHAARIGLALASEAAPDLVERGERWLSTPLPPTPEQVHQAVSLTNRMVAGLADALAPARRSRRR